MDSEIWLSLIIPSKSRDDPKLWNLLKSIRTQDFPKDRLETLAITEGTSESAKSIGIRKAKGKVIGILASDNILAYNSFLMTMYLSTDLLGACFPSHYAPYGNALNRYFALFGCNDPIPFYLGKNDRLTHYETGYNRLLEGTTLGDNGFFVCKKYIEKTDLDHYFHIDNASELGFTPRRIWGAIIHDTSDSLWTILRKRYHYAMQHGFNKDRRWHMITLKDIPRLVWFVVASLTIIQPLLIACYGYSKVKDKAWFLHPIVCLSFLFLYATMTVHLVLRSFYRWLSVQLGGRKVCSGH